LKFKPPIECSLEELDQINYQVKLEIDKEISNKRFQQNSYHKTPGDFPNHNETELLNKPVSTEIIEAPGPLNILQNEIRHKEAYNPTSENDTFKKQEGKKVSADFSWYYKKKVKMLR